MWHLFVKLLFNSLHTLQSKYHLVRCVFKELVDPFHDNKIPWGIILICNGFNFHSLLNCFRRSHLFGRVSTIGVSALEKLGYLGRYLIYIYIYFFYYESVLSSLSKRRCRVTEQLCRRNTTTWWSCMYQLVYYGPWRQPQLKCFAKQLFATRWVSENINLERKI